MNSNSKRPAPLHAIQPRPNCPVCGHPSYSRAGIHPQCAQKQADDRRMEIIKAKQKSGSDQKKAVSPDEIKSWHKRCPKCRIEVHIRRSDCDCGFHFIKRKSD